MTDESNAVATEPQTTEQQDTKTQTVCVKEIGPAARELTIEIFPETIAAKIESSYDQLNTEAAIPGFRRGKAPRKLMERRFGSSVKDDAKAQIISEAYSQAIESEELDVIGEPEVKDIENIELPEEGKALTLIVEVEISPEIDFPDFATLEVTEEAFEVTDADVATEVESLADRYGSMESAGDSAVQEKDFIQADVKILAGKDAKDDAEEISHSEGVYIMVNGKSADYKGHIVGIVVDDLGKQLAGKKVGDTLRISQKGPQSHEDDKIKDQEITLVVRIDNIERVKPVEADKLAVMLGVESEEELTTRIREDLTGRREREQQVAKHDQLREQLLEKVELTLPEKVAGRQVARQLKNEAMQLAYQGMKEDEVEQKIAEKRDESEEEARRQLKLFFILDRIAKKSEIEVTPEELNGRISMMAMMRSERPENLRKQMQQSGELEGLYMSIRDQKTLDKILEDATIKQGTASADKTDKKKKTTKKSTSKKADKK